jgi:hypothetical protein
LTHLIYDFIGQCKRIGITPDESHIIEFLKLRNKLNLVEKFTKFCFYHWENRYKASIVEEFFS